MKLFPHIIISLAVVVTGCVNVNTASDVAEENIPMPPPQLWSDHMRLDLSVKACASKGLRTLKSLSYTGAVQNGNFSYGNFGSNRAAVKCVEDGDGSFVYVMVAGPDKKTVEGLRNDLVRQMR